MKSEKGVLVLEAMLKKKGNNILKLLIPHLRSPW